VQGNYVIEKAISGYPKIEMIRWSKTRKREMTMSLRFLTNAVLALLGGALAVFSMALTAHVAGWIAFGVAIGIVSLLIAIQPVRGRGSVQRLLDGATGILGLWTIAASLVFTGTVLTWLVFGEGALFVALAYAGLVLHEIRAERVVHMLAPAEEREREREREYAELK
jgi:hypothetical protein